MATNDELLKAACNAAASAYADAENTLDLQDAALTIDDVDPFPPLLGGIDREALQYWRNGSATIASGGDHG